MKTLIPSTNEDILAALVYAFDPANVGYTVTLEQALGYPIRIFGLVKSNGVNIRLYIEEAQSFIIVQPEDGVYLNGP